MILFIYLLYNESLKVLSIILDYYKIKLLLDKISLLYHIYFFF